MYDFASLGFMQVAVHNLRENLRKELEGTDVELPELRPTRMMQLRENLSAGLIALGERLQAQHGANKQHVLRTTMK